MEARPEIEPVRTEPPRIETRRAPLPGSVAVAFAALVTGFLLWAVLRPLPKSTPLTSVNPRPDLLDRPHRHEFARPIPSGSAPAQH